MNSNALKFSSIAGVPVVALFFVVAMPIVLIWLAPGVAAIAGLLYISIAVLGEVWMGVAQTPVLSQQDLGRLAIAGALGFFVLVAMSISAVRYYHRSHGTGGVDAGSRSVSPAPH